MNLSQVFGQIINRAWNDEEFCRKLRETPKEAFADFGIRVASDLEIRVVEDTPNLTHFVIPVRPAPLEEVRLDP